MQLTSVVLMAGYSRRMGKLKQHVVLNGKSFLTHITEKLDSFSSHISTKIFVGQESDELGRDQVLKNGGVWITNPTPDDGPLSSIRLAIENTSTDSAIMIWPTDHPLVKQETIDSLIKTWEKAPNLITLPSDGNHRGHPAIFPQWCFEHLKRIELDKGAKAVLQMFPEKINYVLTNDIWITKNINTPELLEAASKELRIEN